jgi:uncharacterized membrane protein YfcA
MDLLTLALLIGCISAVAGWVGSLLGVGGGIIIVPTLSLLAGVSIRHAIAASIVAVVATSSAAASRYLRQGYANIRLGIFLEPATAGGAFLGAFCSGLLPDQTLYLLFGAILIFAATQMLRKPGAEHTCLPPPDPVADRLRLHGACPLTPGGAAQPYRVSRSKTGLAVSAAAGIVSGLLGVGGGLFKVPMMHLAMGVPLKAATATSNFMIGVTASTGAALYFMRGEVIAHIAAPVAIGVIAGSKIGAKCLSHIPIHLLRRSFAVLMLFASLQMLWKAIP